MNHCPTDCPLYISGSRAVATTSLVVVATTSLRGGQWFTTMAGSSGQ